MTPKEILTNIKAFFDAPPAPPAPPTAPVDSTVTTMYSYPVTGGGTIYVNCSDDGIADIDSGDMVYSDPAMTIPYPDGTYTVTGTDFGFTVAAGAVTAVNDADNAGPGLPMEQAAPAAAAAPPAAPPAPTLDQRVAALEAEITNMKKPVTQTGMATEVQLQAASQKIDKHEATIKSLFDLVEKLCQIPSVDPVTLNPAKKEKFDRAEAKEAKLEGIAQAIRKMKEEKSN